MMAKQPGQRYQTPAEVVQALAPLAASAESAGSGPVNGSRRRRWLTATIVGLVGVVLLATVALLGWRPSDGRRPDDKETVVRSTADKSNDAPAQPLEPEGTGKTDVPAAVLAHEEGLKDKDGLVRRTSAESLGNLGDKARGAVPALIGRVADDVWISSRIALYEDPNAGGKAAALAALKKLAPDRVEEGLLKALKSKNPAVKAWATTELGRLHQEE
jgi:HEAT repeat protein